MSGRPRNFWRGFFSVRRTGLSALVVVMVWCGEAGAVTNYHVRLNTSARVGQSALWTIDLVSDRGALDSVEVLNFAHDGRTRPIIEPGSITVSGGPVNGDLLDNANPASRTVVGNVAFRNTLAVPFDSLGTRVAFGLRLPEGATPSNDTPDEVAFFYLKGDSALAATSADPLGAQALFVIGINGTTGGDLSVFSPMTFIPPDTIALDLAGVGVADGSHAGERLRLRSLGPNPTTSGVTLTYDLPAPAGEIRIRVYDVTGRLVAEPFRGPRAPGPWTTRWAGSDSRGRRVPAGVYIVQADAAGQSVVRRVVLVH